MGQAAPVVAPLGKGRCASAGSQHSSELIWWPLVYRVLPTS